VASFENQSLERKYNLASKLCRSDRAKG